MTDLATQGDRQVARPLHVLVPLIRADLKQGDDAADLAGMPYYLAAGDKMNEAKPQMAHGEFERWIKRNFSIGMRQAQQYMKMAHATPDTQKRIAMRSSTLRDSIREVTDNPNYGKPAAWRSEIDEKVKQAFAQSQRLEIEALSRREERDAERKLALQLIDIGFKALASKLHPDKGGSRDAMSRLNRVRDRLKQHA